MLFLAEFNDAGCIHDGFGNGLSRRRGTDGGDHGIGVIVNGSVLPGNVSLDVLKGNVQGAQSTGE